MSQPSSETKTVKIGRPLSKPSKAAQKALDEFLEQTNGNFSTEDVRRVTKQSVVTVRNRLNSLIKSGKIEKVEFKKMTHNGVPARGRPQSIYRKVKGHD